MKKQAVLIPAIMAAANSGCMALVMCAINVGFGPHFLPAFLQSLVIGLVVTLPLSYLLPAALNKLFKGDATHE